MSSTSAATGYIEAGPDLLRAPGGHRHGARGKSSQTLELEEIKSATHAGPDPVIEALEAAFTRIHRNTRVLPVAARREVDQAVGQVLDGLQTLLGGGVVGR